MCNQLFQFVDYTSILCNNYCIKKPYLANKIFNIEITSISQAFINTLDDGTVRKLATRSLRRGIGSMDYIHSLLIAEDDLDDDTSDVNIDNFSGEFETRQQQQGVAEEVSLLSNKVLKVLMQQQIMKVFLHGVSAQIAGPCPKILKINAAN